MPRNEVIERMAKKLYCIDFKGYIAFGEQLLPWEKLKEVVRQTYCNDALELLAIVEEKTYRSYKGGSKFTACNPVLEEAFQLAREAREKRDKR